MADPANDVLTQTAKLALGACIHITNDETQPTNPTPVPSHPPPAHADGIHTHTRHTGLCSDRYSPAATEEEIAAAAASKDSDFTKSIEPRMFKALVGKGHPEFSSGRQQDAQEYLDYLLGVLLKAERVGLGGAFYTEGLFKCVVVMGVVVWYWVLGSRPSSV